METIHNQQYLGMTGSLFGGQLKQWKTPLNNADFAAAYENLFSCMGAAAQLQEAREA